jgi:predicted nucleotidyltransferase
LGKGQDSGEVYMDKELYPLEEVLSKLRAEGKILVAILFGSYANGAQHVRSDID